MNKLIIICGPTATGKTEVGIKLAKKFNGEIISADSRQVYKGMDIGTGKYKEIYEKNNIRVWGIDLVNPDYQFNLGDYKKYAFKKITEISQRKKLPIVVGGTGLYIKSLISPLDYTAIPPDEKLREKNYDVETLKKILDADWFKSLNNSDQNNPRRLIRAIEISNYLKKHTIQNDDTKLDCLIIGLTAPKEVTFEKVKERVEKRIKQGIVEEIKKLKTDGFGWDLPSMSGLGYREFRDYFENNAGLEEVKKRWIVDEINYAKRQITWFKKMKDIVWFDISKVSPKRLISQILFKISFLFHPS